MRSHRLPRSLMSSLFRVLLIAFLLTACGTALADDGKKVVGGYFEEWSIYFANFNIANLQNNGVAERLTHLFYAFGGVNSTGCVIADPFADYQASLPTITGPYTGPLYGNFAALQQLKQLHPNLKVLISLAGAPGFSAAAATEAGRQAFAASCIDLFINGNVAPGISAAGVFDGIDVDWEFPAPPDTANVTLLMREFRQQLNALGRTNHRH
jgi:chitinase